MYIYLYYIHVRSTHFEDLADTGCLVHFITTIIFGLFINIFASAEQILSKWRRKINSKV